MPWESKTVEELRKEFIIAAKYTKNFSSLCREFGITRKTGYKWIERSAKTDDLSDGSHARKNISNKTSTEIENRILSIRRDNPGWGAKTIHKVLENQGCNNLPCVKTVNNILNRYGCISPEESVKHKPYQRFEREQCNQMWQTDFKG